MRIDFALLLIRDARAFLFEQPFLADLPGDEASPFA